MIATGTVLGTLVVVAGLLRPKAIPLMLLSLAVAVVAGVCLATLAKACVDLGPPPPPLPIQKP